jgi:hypothetical protein
MSSGNMYVAKYRHRASPYDPYSSAETIIEFSFICEGDIETVRAEARRRLLSDNMFKQLLFTGDTYEVFTAGWEEGKVNTRGQTFDEYRVEKLAQYLSSVTQADRDKIFEPNASDEDIELEVAGIYSCMRDAIFHRHPSRENFVQHLIDKWIIEFEMDDVDVSAHFKDNCLTVVPMQLDKLSFTMVGHYS